MAGVTEPASQPKPVRVEVVAPAVEEEEAPSPRLRRTGDRTLSEVLHEAAGGADKAQLEALRARISRLESRVTESLASMRRQEKLLANIRIAAWAIVVIAAVALVVALLL